VIATSTRSLVTRATCRREHRRCRPDTSSSGVPRRQVRRTVGDARPPLAATGPWKWAVMRDLPHLFGVQWDRLRSCALGRDAIADPEQTKSKHPAGRSWNFIFSSTCGSADEEQVAPTFTRMAWQVAKTLTGPHLPPSLYDLFAVTRSKTKRRIRKLLADYLEKQRPLRRTGSTTQGSMEFPSRSPSATSSGRSIRRSGIPWFQAAVYDVQLTG